MSIINLEKHLARVQLFLQTHRTARTCQALLYWVLTQNNRKISLNRWQNGLENLSYEDMY